MDSRIRVYAMILVLLAQAGCGPRLSPDTAGHVAYGLSAAIDGKALPALVGITAESCYDSYGGYVLTFTATADMIPEAIDDEIGLGLEISIEDISKIIVGKPMDVANNLDIRFLASPTSFIDPAVLKPLNVASGTITITKLQANEISGSASLTFSDPGDVNALVNDSLAYEVMFTNLAVIHYCPEPTPIQQDEIAIYQAVIRQLSGPDDTYGGTLEKSILYIIRSTDDTAGDPSLQDSRTVVLSETVQSGITQAMADLPSEVVWVNSDEVVEFDEKTGYIPDGGVIITLGNIQFEDSNKALVPGSILVARGAAGGAAYVVERKDGRWIVTGKIGEWIS